MDSESRIQALAALAVAAACAVLCFAFWGPGTDEPDALTFGSEGEPAPATATLEGSVSGSRQEPAPPPADAPVSEPDRSPARAPEQPSARQLVFWCRILTDDGSEAIADAHVRLLLGEHLMAGDMSEERFEAKSDPSGLCRLQLLKGARANAYIEAAGFGPAVIAVGPGHEESENALEIRLSLSASLSVRILDAHSEPVVGTEVKLSTASYRITRPEGETVFAGDLAWTGTTDEEGFCMVPDLPPDVPLAATATQGQRKLYKAAEPLLLTSGELRELVWQLGSGAALAGRLIDQHGEPVVAQVVWLTPQALYATLDQSRTRIYFYRSDAEHVVKRATTDARGHFAFADVPTGTWWVGPAPGTDGDESALEPLGAVAAVGTKVEIDAEIAREPIELRVYRGLYLRGRVVQPDGAPAPSTHVSSASALGGIATYARHGAFVLGPLEPVVHSVRANGTGGHADSKPVKSSPPRQDLVLELGLGASIRGRFVDALTGEPCKGALVLWCDDPPLLSIEDPGSGATSTFGAKGLAPGIYAATCVTADGRIGILRGIAVKRGADTKGLEVRVAQGTKLRIHYKGPARYAQFTLLSDGAVFGADGLLTDTSQLELVTAGMVVVRMDVRGRPAQESEVWCEVGKVVDAVFEFE